MIKKIILLGMLAITLASASACTKVDMSSQSEALEKGGETPPPSLALPMPTVSPEPVFTHTPAPTSVAVPTFTPMPTIEPFDTGVPKEIDELVAWLGEALENGNISSKRLRRKEIANLNDMVFLLNWGDCFASSEEVSKEELLFAVSMYSQDAVDLERSTGEYFPNQSVLYPFEGYEKFDHYSDTLYYTIEQTNQFVFDLYGVNIPNPLEELDEQYDYALFRGDRYSFRFTDTYGYNYMLERYDYLGDGLYYLSFASNDSHWPGHPENLNGILKDFCRLLVKRSESKWGFTVVAKLKDGEDSLLPEDFPLPKIAVG